MSQEGSLYEGSVDRDLLTVEDDDEAVIRDITKNAYPKTLTLDAAYESSVPICIMYGYVHICI